MFFSGEKQANYSYVLISFFVHYIVSHLGYIFLKFFLSNFKLFDSNNIIRIYLATHTKLAIFSDETSSSANVLILLSPCLSINFFFWIFLQTFLQVNFSVFWALNLLCHLPSFFRVYDFYIFLNTVNAGYCELGETHGVTWAIHIANNTLKNIVTQGPILVSRSWVTIY